MSKQPLPKPDLTHGAPAGEGEQPSTSAPKSASPALFDAIGSVAPAEPTANASMPEAPPVVEKRGRGRPKGAQKKTAQKTPEQAERQGVVSAHLIVGALDLLRKTISGGECPQGDITRDMTVEAWREYLEQNGWEVPAWVQVAVISTMYVAPAFHTERGHGVLRGAWTSVKSAYVKWRG